MKINVRGDKVKVTESIKKKINEKIGKLDKYFDAPEEITAGIIIRVKEKKQIIEVTIPTKKYTIRAEEKHQDLYAAVDLVIDKLERQIRKNKTRLSKKVKVEDTSMFNFNYEDDIDKEEKIMKRKNVEVMPMDEEEAILQLELIDHDFYVFNNIDEGCLSVIYKRKDGAYGIINTK